MHKIELRTLGSQLRAVLEQSGLPDAVGGPAAFEAGLRELRARLLPIVSELVLAAEGGVDLSTVVLDVERFPHVAELHGILADALELPLPAEMATWLRKIAAMGRLPAAEELGRAIARISTLSPNVAHRELARLGLLELICLQNRLRLRGDGTQLEAIGGRRQDVEVLAEAEVDMTRVLARSSSELLELEDPIQWILSAASEALARYVDLLRAELLVLSRDTHEQLERRQRILEAAARVEPADAVLILNETADEFGEERLTAKQLRRAHPGLIGGMSNNLIYKKVERLPKHVADGSAPKTQSLADTLIEIMREVKS